MKSYNQAPRRLACSLPQSNWMRRRSGKKSWVRMRGTHSRALRAAYSCAHSAHSACSVHSAGENGGADKAARYTGAVGGQAGSWGHRAAQGCPAQCMDPASSFVLVHGAEAHAHARIHACMHCSVRRAQHDLMQRMPMQPGPRKAALWHAALCFTPRPIHRVPRRVPVGRCRETKMAHCAPTHAPAPCKTLQTFRFLSDSARCCLQARVILASVLLCTLPYKKPTCCSAAAWRSAALTSDTSGRAHTSAGGATRACGGWQGARRSALTQRATRNY